MGVVDHSTSGIGHGVQTSPATPVALTSTSTKAKWVTIQAQTDNSSSVAVGGSGVAATVATGTGILLAAGETVTLPVYDLSYVYIDALVSGEGVRYIYGY